jgi:hypothetical protein
LVGEAFDVVRQTNWLKVALEFAPAAADAGFGFIGPEPISMSLVLIKLAINLGLVVTAEVIEVKNRLEGDRDEAYWRSLRGNAAFAVGPARNAVAHLNALEDWLEVTPLSAEFPLDEPPKEVMKALRELGDWKATVGAELASAWGHIVIYDPQGPQVLQDMANSLARMTQSLRDVRVAARAGDQDRALAAVAAAKQARDALAEGIFQLIGSLDKHSDPAG